MDGLKQAMKTLSLLNVRVALKLKITIHASLHAYKIHLRYEITAKTYRLETWVKVDYRIDVTNSAQIDKVCEQICLCL